MSITSPQEGTAPFTIPSIDTPCTTYYKIFGDLHSGPPLIVLHGGPGSGHEYCLPFSNLSRHGMPVVFYDQIGCAKSTHLPSTAGDESFWTVDLFVAELENLLQHLKIGPGSSHVLGHSFGGIVAAAFAACRPEGLWRLVLAGAPADGEVFRKSLLGLKARMSVEAQRAVDEAVRTGDSSGPAYEVAMEEFVRTFLCRAEVWPPEELKMDFQHQMEDTTVRRTMQGRPPWVYNGTLNRYSSIPLLSQIAVPTLVYNGEFDTAQYEDTVPLFDHIPKIRRVTLPKASHMPHLDSEKMLGKVLELVGKFLGSASAR